MSILAGEGARMEFTGITFAGAGQDLDTGAKVVHAAPNTSSHITTKSIARDGGVSNFRSSVTVLAVSPALITQLGNAGSFTAFGYCCVSRHTAPCAR